ncbi:MAG: hypothetical protein KDB07_08105, partial [Planctomycetes bacterium]|nr:hypothetical protein [Planctomycetota bacterium]
LSIDKRGTGYTLNFSEVGTPANMVGPSNAFNVTVGNVASLEMLQQPAGLKAGRLLTTQPTVRGRDLGGNLVTAMSVDVQARLAMTVASATIVGMGTAAGVPDVLPTAAGTGVATFTDLQINADGSELPANFTIEFFVPLNMAIASATSNQFQLILGTILLETRLDDHDKNNDVSANDELYFYFDEAVALDSVPTTNVANALDIAFGLSGGATFGAGATATIGDDATNGANTVVIVRVAAGETITSGVTTSLPSTANPPASITDVNGNEDVTPMAVAIANGTTDIFAPTVDDMTINPSIATVGDTVEIVVTYSDVQTVLPTFTLTAPSLPMATNMVLTAAEAAGGRVYTYTYFVQPHDGVNNFDGVYTFNFTGENNGNNPGMYLFSDTTTLAKQFTVDSRTPVFADVRIFKVVAGNPVAATHFRDTNQLRIEVDLAGENGMFSNANVTADLSSIGNGAMTALTPLGGGMYRQDVFVTSGGANSLFNVFNLTASDGANNMAMTTAAIVLDNTPPQPILTYGRPADMLVAGDFTITAQFPEDVSTPSIEITGINGLTPAGVVEMTGPAIGRTFTVAVNVPAGETGTGTVTMALAQDVAGNAMVQANPNTFEVLASAPTLIANSGPDQVLTNLQQVNLSGSGSSGATTFDWVVTDPNGLDATNLLNTNNLSQVHMMPTLP